ncbi:hypothetical protein TRAPUB_1027 [Trametes pubescens]|uniref:Uncharacterized protein n=1 Tax=Trametes pubescens TaxID=154538 RepID=A0A1M2VKL7_TRAPU|nr:hypothetical protein TRAPUB_1027 [Trametes pubescens]
MARSSEDLVDALLRLRQARRQSLIGSIVKSPATFTSRRHLVKFGAAPPSRHAVKLDAAMKAVPSSGFSTQSVHPHPPHWSLRFRHLARPQRQPSPFPPAAFHDIDQAPPDFKFVCSLNAVVSRGSSPFIADVPPYVK